jgi:hypothetical protein
MKWSEKVEERIVMALDARGAAKSCPLCQLEKTWTLVQGYAIVKVSDDTLPNPMQPPKSYFPCVLLLCNNCGNTHFINLLRLGLDDVVFGSQALAAKKD